MIKPCNFFVQSKYLLFSVLISVVSVVPASAEPPKGKVTEEVSIKSIIAQQEETTQAIATIKESDDITVPDDDFMRGEPRSTMLGYIKAMRAGDSALAIQYLDFRNISSQTASFSQEELVRQLWVVLNRTLWIDLNSISDRSAGDLDDGLPSYRELIGHVSVEGVDLPLYLQRIPRASDRVKIWKISNATVEKIPQLFQAYSYSPAGEWLAKHLPAVDFLGVMLWQWLYFFLMFVVYYLGALLATRAACIAIKRLYVNVSEDVLRFIKGPIALLIAILVARSFREEANVTLAVNAIMEGSTLLIVAWCWVFFRFIELMKIVLTQKFIRQDKQLAVYLLRPAGTVIKLVIALIAIVHWLESLGFNASTLLAGLGIGGLAIALAAQKTVENIIGAITLYTSAPVKIGDLCKFDNSIGVVEEIGLRATRIRTLDRTVIHVANAKFIDMELENFSEREKMAFRPKLYLSPSTSKENLTAFLAAVRETIQSVELLEEAPQRAHFKNYSMYGLELDILVYVKTTTFDVYLDEINQLNLAILALLNQHHCQLQVVSERNNV